MTRYIKQPDSYSCGPVAVINMLKWMGVPVGLRELPKMKFMLGTDPKVGTLRDTMHAMIQNLVKLVPGGVMWVQKHVTFKQLKDHLGADSNSYLNAAILHYHIKEWVPRKQKSEFEGHYIFMGPMHSDHFHVVNEYDTDRASAIVSPAHIQNRLSCRRDKAPKHSIHWMKDSPFAWLISL